jgi:hypothetical protein
VKIATFVEWAGSVFDLHHARGPSEVAANGVLQIMADQIANWSDLSVLLSATNACLFRGQTVDEPLRPSVFRNEKHSRGESNLLIAFRNQAPPRCPVTPSWDNKPAWMTLAQHYGVPTRLLDWTASPLAAAFFAVWEEKHDDKDGVIWALDPAIMNKRCAGKFRGRAVATLITMDSFPAIDLVNDAFEERQSRPLAVAISPAHCDLRMLVQQAYFTIHGNNRPLEELYVEADGVTQPHLQRYVVPACSKACLRDQLDQAGVKRASLFPDLSALAAYLRDTDFVIPELPPSQERPIRDCK